MTAEVFGLIDANNYVRREVALLIVLTVLAGQDRLFHQPYPKEEMR